MVISNCTRCNRVYQVSHSGLCPECYHEYKLNFSHVYRFVQENPAHTLEEIARQCRVPLAELQSLFFKGALGTATEHIRYSCQRCGIPMAPIQRCGRFCFSCTEKVEAEAKINQTPPEEEPQSFPQQVRAAKTRNKPAYTINEPAAQTYNTEPPRQALPPERNSDSYGFKRPG